MAYLQDLVAEFRTFPRTVKFFYVTDIFFAFSQAIFGTLFNLHMLEAGFNPDHIGQLQSLSSLIMAGLAIPVGVASDRWGRRWFYVAGSLLFGVPYLIMPWLQSFPAMMIAWIVYSAGTTLMFVNESPLLAGEVGADKRASVFSFMMINFFVWNTLGIQLAGWLVNWLPHGALTQYQWPLVAAGVAGIASGAIRGLLPFRSAGPARRELNLRPTRTAVMLGLASILSGAFFALLFNFNNVILKQRFAYGADDIATVLTIAGVVGWAGSVLVPWTSRRLGDLKAYVICIGLQTGLLLAMGAATSPVLFLSLFWIRSVLGTMQMPLWNAFAMGVSPEAERATASSYSMLGRSLGAAAAAKVFGVMLTAGSYVAAFSLAGALALAAALFTLLAFRHEARFAAGTERA
ncbi:MAG TPA: MFS transporter [Symbiobacteriaceae bacterium]|nr:MFS transporter [Symbiobacteriaceae bacterium]